MQKRPPRKKEKEKSPKSQQREDEEKERDKQTEEFYSSNGLSVGRSREKPLPVSHFSSHNKDKDKDFRSIGVFLSCLFVCVRSLGCFVVFSLFLSHIRSHTTRVHAGKTQAKTGESLGKIFDEPTSIKDEREMREKREKEEKAADAAISKGVWAVLVCLCVCVALCRWFVLVLLFLFLTVCAQSKRQPENARVWKRKSETANATRWPNKAQR